MPPRSPATLQQLVAQYPPGTQALIAATRRFIRAAVPGADETADATARLIGYGYGPGYKGVVVTLILSKTSVKIGIPYGARLPDPAGLLRGAGKVHRHIVVASPADLRRPTLKKLLNVALGAWRERSDGA